MSRREVVVTGLGATTPLGGDVASTWEAMVAGRSGVVAITEDWAQQLPVRIAAFMKADPGTVMDRVKLRRLDRSEAAALIAAHQAWADAEHWRAIETHAPAARDSAIGIRLHHIHMVQRVFMGVFEGGATQRGGMPRPRGGP